MKKKTSNFKLSVSEVERIKAMVPTIGELRVIDLMRDYRVYRNRYFGTTIPPVEEVLIRFLPRHEMTRLSGYNDKETVGLCSFGRFKGSPCMKAIIVAEDITLCETKITLIHEMAHMKVDTKFNRAMGHGENWKKEMRRLAAAKALDNWW